MAKSKVDKSRKEKVVNFKNKQKQMSEQTNTNQNPNVPQLPPVRSFPVWAPDAEIKVNGRVWEAINNGLSAIQTAQQASQAILTENLLNGTMQMEFEKLDPNTLQYVEMTEEEKKPHRDEFNKAVEMIRKTQQVQAEPQTESVSDIKSEPIPVEKLEE